MHVAKGGPRTFGHCGRREERAMNEATEGTVERTSRNIYRTLLVGVPVAIGLVVLLSGFVPWPLALLFYLTVGWGFFLVRVAPQVSFNIGSVLTGVLAVVLFAVFLHLALGWLYGPAGSRTADGSPRMWRRRWTAGIASLILLAFASGISALGVIHQVGWLATAPDQNQNNMKNVVLALHNHHATIGYFPPGYTVDEAGRPLHGWQMRLLPYLEQDNLYNQIQLDRPWDDQANRAAFCREIHEYTSPYFGPQFDADGYSLSHYAGNSHAFPGSKKKGLRISDFKNGTSNIILFGEVSAGFRPWGHPLNVRDPARGVGSAVDRFGGPWPDGQTCFAFGDGSVRSVPPNSSPAILKAYATPARR